MLWLSIEMKRLLSLVSLLLFVSVAISPSDGVNAPAVQQRTWAKTYGGFELDLLHSVQQISDGGFVLSGATGSFSDDDIWVLKLLIHSSGRYDVLWSRHVRCMDVAFGLEW